MTDVKIQKFKQERPYAKPEAAARKLIEIARTLPVDKGRMCVGKWNDLVRAAGGSVDEYAAGRDQAIADGVIVMHECGGFVMSTPTGAAVSEPQ
ncbi:MAG: hypothetical protein JWR09_5792 [Mucilaginibacter sp.]|nr:hypothetical protein [Mucilaginibacter sp.]